MSDPRDKEQREEASPTYKRDLHGVPAHIQAAAEAAGESDLLAGGQDIGYAAALSGSQAIHTQHAIRDTEYAFDTHNPPSPDLIDDCVQCGFCLPTCPTYLLWGEEMDSPRGRIHLMKLGNEGKVGMTPTFVLHMDNCLGCMACVTACPSGVQYEKLIESTRQQIERRHDRTLSDRLFRTLIFAVVPHPARLRVLARLLWLYRRSGLQRLAHRSGLIKKLPARFANLHDLAPPVTRRGLGTRLPGYVPANGERRARVGLLEGCVQRVFFGHVNAATARVLASEGCDVVSPEGQGCCGALALHTGREAEAKRYARRLIAAFEKSDLDYVVVNAAGCGSSMKEYGHLLRDDPEYAQRAEGFSARVRDVSELLAELGPVAPRTPVRAKVAYHDACHLAHAQGVRRQPRDLLRSIPGIELLPIAEGEICCGSAGVYNLLEPQPAAELGERKARNILDTGAQIVASANPGCALQIEASARRLGNRLRVVHPIELLDLSLHRRKR
jgi:glycolate oxidase iron-sulfur subunit